MNALDPTSESPGLVDFTIEQAFLGACLANNEVWHRVADRLRPEHFADALHARIFDAIGKSVGRGYRADINTLRKQFEQDEAMIEAGGAGYLIEIASAVVTVRDAPDYAEAIIDLWRRRQIRDAAVKAIGQITAFTPNLSAVDVLESLEAKLSDIASSGASERSAITAFEAMSRAIEAAEATAKHGGTIGVPTGLRDLDRILGGLQRPDLIILAGRPSMGKTALAINMGFSAAAPQSERLDEAPAPHRVLAFSLEMSAEQLGQRLVAMQTGIPVDRQRSGFATMDEIAAMVEATARLNEISFWIDDDASLTVQGMTARARRIQRQRGLDLVIVDHLGRIKGGRGDRPSGIYETVTRVVRDCKTMAKTLNVPVVLLVQLSRSVEQRDDKRPQLSDLRDSGAIEEEADVVMFIYREEYYLERSEPKPAASDSDEKYQKKKQAWDRQMMAASNVAEVLVAKNRQGPIRNAKVRFDGPRQLFQDLQA